MQAAGTRIRADSWRGPYGWEKAAMGRRELRDLFTRRAGAQAAPAVGSQCGDRPHQDSLRKSAPKGLGTSRPPPQMPRETGKKPSAPPSTQSALSQINGERRRVNRNIRSESDHQLKGCLLLGPWARGLVLGRPGWRSVFVATVDFVLRLLQDTQHLLDDGPQRPAQLVCVVWLAQWRHVDKS